MLLLQRWYLEQSFYLIVDFPTATAAVVNPPQNVAPILKEAEGLGVEIRHILLSDFESNHASAHQELVRQTGATLYLSTSAERPYPFVSLKDGETIEFGEIRIGVRESHSAPDGIMDIIVYDLARDPMEPFAFLRPNEMLAGEVRRALK